MDELLSGVRAAVQRRAGWRETAQLVAAELERRLPSPDVLTREQQNGDAAGYRSHVLHTEPDGTFTIVALVWRLGQVTHVHDHVTWCVFGVIQGVEYEELFTLDEENDCLVEAGKTANWAGDVSGFAPPGDIHRVRNVGGESTSEFTPFDEALLPYVPDGIRSGCRHVKPLTDNFDASISCRAGGPITSLTYSHARSGQYLFEFMRQRRDKVGLPEAARAGLCSAGVVPSLNYTVAMGFRGRAEAVALYQWWTTDAGPEP